MALDNLAGIKSISVPTWLKLLIFIIVLAVLIADLTTVWIAVTNPLHKDWFSVSVQLLGSLVPLLLVILLVAFSTRGTEAISRKTTHLLLHLVPSTIANSLTWSPEFETVDQAQWNRRRRGNTRIEVAHRPGDFSCMYRILFPDIHSKPPATRVLILVVELKVRQVNMHLCVPRATFEKFCRHSGLAGYEAFRKAFDSTLSGAERAGCKINTAVYQLPLAQDSLQTVVVVCRELSTDFFTDPSEQLFWVQDMVTMLKGFVEEGLDDAQPVKWFSEAGAKSRSLATAGST
ncbi:MAG TPA: hypothetical protein VFL42_09465 [Terriglobales bacterium]|jgi:hypothetical protein|nr:hypothetical protein [Terriglobales bacterium]